MLRCRRGFTLLEICLAIMVGLFLVTMAVPSVSGLLEERRAMQSFEALDALVQEAHARSLTERRAFLLAWETERIVLRPEQPAGKDEKRGLGEIPTSRENGYTVEFPAALVKNPAPVWTFWPSGTCEPAIVRYQGEHGAWLARYDPLTVRGTREQ